MELEAEGKMAKAERDRLEAEYRKDDAELKFDIANIDEMIMRKAGGDSS